MNRPSTRHLVAPELLPALDFFPSLDISGGIETVRNFSSQAAAMPLPPELEAVTCEERFIPGLNDAPDVRVLHYTPPGEAQSPRPAMIEIHGGGYILGTADMSDPANRAMALEHSCTLVSVDYRLAPETRWPGALEDCYAALCWLDDNADTLGIDRARIAISGGSAGGGHAAALAIHARNVNRETGGGPKVCFQLIDFPMLDDRTASVGDPHPVCGEFVWTPEHNRFGWEALLGMAPGGEDVPAAMVPARVEDLSDLPPAFISIGALDLFLDESLEYTRRLAHAGVPVELHVIPGGFHGFGLAADAPQSRQAMRLRSEAIARAFASG
ncbi:MAG: alpha/beta hydrolase [Sphingomonadaceae bacterium]